MQDSARDAGIDLTILITVVSGRDALRRCLEALAPQVDSSDTEVIVPYDRWSLEVRELMEEFPQVRLHYIDDLGCASSESVPSHAHRLYDRRRAVGLSLARGRLVAMTEDHAVPAPDWCRRIIAAHARPVAVVGGAIENGVDRPLNWALYYCDFGRYGRPLPEREAKYASDVNVAYKRSALESISHVWREAYHETTVHWALMSRGEKVTLDSSLVVHQRRPKMALGAALKERVEWGRVFAETRVARCGTLSRMLYVAGTPLLPALLAARIIGHMIRQRRGITHILKVLPLVICLLSAWAVGELTGYLAGEPRTLESLATAQARAGGGRP